MSDKLNIQDLIDLLAEKHSMNRSDAESFVREFFALIEESLEKDKYVKIRGLGTFRLINVESRESININTGERFEILGHAKISFTPETLLKEAINKPFAHFESVLLNDNVVFDDMSATDSSTDDDDNESKTVTEDSVIQCQEEETATVVSTNNISEPERTLVESEEENHSISIEQTELPEEEKMPVEEEDIEENIENLKNETSSEHQEGGGTALMKYLVSTAIIVVLICIAVVGAMYWPDLMQHKENEVRISDRDTIRVEDTDKNKSQLDSITMIGLESNGDSGKAIADTIKATTQDTVNSETIKKNVTPKASSTPQKDVKKTVKASKDLFILDSVDYEIVGTKATYTMKEGETLTKISLRFYGTKALWPYIVKHNQELIKNPDNVPSGVTIKIPDLIRK